MAAMRSMSDSAVRMPLVTARALWTATGVFDSAPPSPAPPSGASPALGPNASRLAPFCGDGIATTGGTSGVSSNSCFVSRSTLPVGVPLPLRRDRMPERCDACEMSDRVEPSFLNVDATALSDGTLRRASFCFMRTVLFKSEISCISSSASHSASWMRSTADRFAPSARADPLVCFRMRTVRKPDGVSDSSQRNVYSRSNRMASRLRWKVPRGSSEPNRSQSNTRSVSVLPSSSNGQKSKLSPHSGFSVFFFTLVLFVWSPIDAITYGSDAPPKPATPMSAARKSSARTQNTVSTLPDATSSLASCTAIMMAPTNRLSSMRPARIWNDTKYSVGSSRPWPSPLTAAHLAALSPIEYA
mmetsp:Transcript_7495/g.26752  ORF Transcript_7495/g.26752 Transcript_7495/m.26752 type:complete len:357 (+) Transcript_7495:1867-2937(+)